MESNVTVLFVEDNRLALESRARFLAATGTIEVVTETDVESGLSRLEDVDIDCVLSDYELSGPSGLDFLVSVRTSRPDLPFILYTASAAPELIDDALQAGVTDIIEKRACEAAYGLLANRIFNAVDQFRLRERIEATGRPPTGTKV